MSLADDLAKPEPKQCVFGRMLARVDNPDEIVEALHDVRVSDPRLRRHLESEGAKPPSTSTMGAHRLGTCGCTDG